MPGRTELPILHARPGIRDLVYHSDRGVQYLSIRCSERLAKAGVEASVGTVGDSYDNALAETINGLYKTEIIHPNGPWKSRPASGHIAPEFGRPDNVLLGPCCGKPA